MSQKVLIRYKYEEDEQGRPAKVRDMLFIVDTFYFCDNEKWVVKVLDVTTNKMTIIRIRDILSWSEQYD